MMTLDLAPSLSPRPEAVAALELLDSLLDGFRFASPVDRSVALSAMMTAVLRPKMTTSPLHAITCRGSHWAGKSTLVDLCAALATGKDRCPSMTRGGGEAELGRRVRSVITDGDPIFAFHHSGTFRSRSFRTVLEEPRSWYPRQGGRSGQLVVNKTAFFVEGTALKLCEDLARCAVVCTLEPWPSFEEGTLARPAFDFHPIDRVLKDRDAYQNAVREMSRGFGFVGEEPFRCAPLSLFETWNTLVRSPLVWLGRPDPAASMTAAREKPRTRILEAAQ